MLLVLKFHQQPIELVIDWAAEFSLKGQQQLQFIKVDRVLAIWPKVTSGSRLKGTQVPVDISKCLTIAGPWLPEGEWRGVAEWLPSGDVP